MHRRPFGIAVALCVALAVPAGCLADTVDPAANPIPLPVNPMPGASAAPGRPELPRGGRQVFPEHQLVAFVGLPGSPALGPLHGELDTKAAELERLATTYAAGRTPLPVLELIVVVANARAGRDGMYRSRIADTEVQRYLDVARSHKMLLLLDIQPGRADTLTEVKRYERWLSMPDVGLAFDPEWAVARHQVPGKVFGRTTGAELDAVAAYLASLVRRHDLPEKVFVFHQLAPRIVQREHDLRRRPGVVVVKSVDGIGKPTDKVKAWRRLTPAMAPGVHAGFKLFYEEDTRHGKLMTPAQVLALRPRPELVTYE